MEKTLKVFEQDLREEIANKIEKFIELNVETNWVDIRSFKVAASIARGEVMK